MHSWPNLLLGALRSGIRRLKMNSILVIGASRGIGLELVREIKPEEMQVPIRNKR